MSAGVIRWEEPPPDGRTVRGRKLHLIPHELISVQLRRKPDEWAVVAEYSGSKVSSARDMSWQISHGKFRSYAPTGSFESVARLVDGVACVYARYVGDPS